MLLQGIVYAIFGNIILIRWTRERTQGLRLSTSCSSRGPMFDSQHSHGDSQPPISTVPVNQMPSSHFLRPQSFTWYTNIHANKTSVDRRFYLKMVSNLSKETLL